MIYIGIDPGVNGGIAFLSDDGEARGIGAIKMPATDRDILDELRKRKEPNSTRLIAHAYLERVSAGVFGTARRMGVSSAFTFGGGYRALQMALTAEGIPFDLVSPLKWQNAMGCRSHGDKNVTKRRAQQLFPMIKVTHAIADALLIAEYGRRLRESHGQEERGNKAVKGEEAAHVNEEAKACWNPRLYTWPQDQGTALASPAGDGAGQKRQARSAVRVSGRSARTNQRPTDR